MIEDTITDFATTTAARIGELWQLDGDKTARVVSDLQSSGLELMRRYTDESLSRSTRLVYGLGGIMTGCDMVYNAAARRQQVDTEIWNRKIILPTLEGMILITKETMGVTSSVGVDTVGPDTDPDAVFLSSGQVKGSAASFVTASAEPKKLWKEPNLASLMAGSFSTKQPKAKKDISRFHGSGSSGTRADKASSRQDEKETVGGETTQTTSAQQPASAGRSEFAFNTPLRPTQYAPLRTSVPDFGASYPSLSSASAASAYSQMALGPISSGTASQMSLQRSASVMSPSRAPAALTAASSPSSMATAASSASGASKSPKPKEKEKEPAREAKAAPATSPAAPSTPSGQQKPPAAAATPSQPATTSVVIGTDSEADRLARVEAKRAELQAVLLDAGFQPNDIQADVFRAAIKATNDSGVDPGSYKTKFIDLYRQLAAAKGQTMASS